MLKSKCSIFAWSSRILHLRTAVQAVRMRSRVPRDSSPRPKQRAQTGSAGPPPVVSVDDGGPDLGELTRALLDLGEALARARGPGKRGLLLAGFHAGLSQGNLALGMSRLLWDLTGRLEAPEVRVLEILAMDDDAVEPVSAQRDPFLLVRLRDLSLVEARPDGGWRASSLGRRLLEFVHGWDDAGS